MTGVKIEVLEDIEAVDWNSMPHDTSFPRLDGHYPQWLASIRDGLRHRVWLLQASRDQKVVGLLPLVLVKGPIFGRFMVSLPYLNTGGVWAQDKETALTLVDVACDLAEKLQVKYLELRHEVPVEHPKLNYRRTDKVHMRLALPDSEEKLLKSFKSKLRSQVKKSGEYGLNVSWGSAELLEPFYDVFAENMRDLGTPVFSKHLFRSILKEFGTGAELCVVKLDKQPVAGGLLMHVGGVSEVPSASSLRRFNRTNANMLMYWNLLKRSVEKGSSTFDFGRSSENSGTYAFKEQWGAKPFPAVWQYYLRKGSPEEMRPDSDGKKKLVEIWQKLPVWLTRLIGPEIVRGIP